MSAPNDTVKELIIRSEQLTPTHGSRGEISDDGAAMALEADDRKPLGSFKAFAGWLALNFAV